MFNNIRQLLYPGKCFLQPEPKTNPGCFHTRGIQGSLNGLHTPKRATARPEILYQSLPLDPQSPTGTHCDITGGMSRNNDTQRLKQKKTVTAGLSTNADPGRRVCASRAAAPVRPTIGLAPLWGRGPSPYSLALALAERVAAPAPDAPLPPPPEPPPLPPLLGPPPPPPLPAAPVLPLVLAFLAGATPAAATVASVLPSAGPPPVAPRH